jgi:hypothetical protein
MRPISWKGQFLNAGGFTDMISTPKYAWIFLVLLCSHYLFCCKACSIQPLHEISPISYTCPVRCISRPYITSTSWSPSGRKYSESGVPNKQFSSSSKAFLSLQLPFVVSIALFLYSCNV